MGYLALICGLLVGVLFLTDQSIYWKLFLYFYFYRYRDESRFYSYYDRYKRPEIFSLLDHQGVISNYSQYVKIFKKFRSKSYKEFIELFEIIAQLVVFKYFLFCVASSILFLSYWYCYLLGLGLSFALLTIYHLILNKYLFIFCQDLPFTIIMNDYFKKIRWPNEADRP